jgi:hypothetical protein
VLTFCRAVDGLTHNRTVHDRSPRCIPHTFFFRSVNPFTLSLAIWRGIVLLQRDTKHIPPPSQRLDKTEFQADVLAPHVHAVRIEPQPTLQQHARSAHPAVRELVRRSEHV